MDMTVTEAQTDMRRGYYSGAPGILASALAWAASAATSLVDSPERAIWVLLFAGMLIHPFGLLFCRLLGAPASHTKGNPFGQLAGASTFWLIFSLPLAYGLGLSNAAWFFSAMLLVIGGRYLVFATLYGMRLYWALGLALALAGVLLAWLRATPLLAVATGAAIEFAFAIAAVVQHRHWVRPNNHVWTPPSSSRCRSGSLIVGKRCGCSRVSGLGVGVDARAIMESAGRVPIVQAACQASIVIGVVRSGTEPFAMIKIVSGNSRR